MDAATVLEEYLSDITNLPTDLAFILDEIQGHEEHLRDIQKKIAQKDASNQKFIKTHGSLVENPKEAASYPRIRSEFQEALDIQDEKCNLANTGLYIVSRYVKKLEDQIRALERDGTISTVRLKDDSEGFMPSRRRADRGAATTVVTSNEATPQAEDNTPKSETASTAVSSSASGSDAAAAANANKDIKPEAT